MNHKKAVATVVSTLIVMAITMTGGIMLFIFVQNYYQTSSIPIPRAEILEIFGYDASDTVNLRTHTAASLPGAGGAFNQKLADNESFSIYVRNRGANPVVIETINVFGSTYTFDAASTTISSIVPANNKWIATKGNATAPTTTTGTQIINPGEELTIVIAYDTDVNGDIKMGRPIPVAIKTGNGAVFTKQLQNGLRVD